MATTTTNEKGLTHDSTSEEVARVVESVHAKYQQMCNELSGTIVGMKDVTEQLMIGILCRGHCILQGMPGLAKTLLISQLARLMDLSFHRIQFTPDLMPADITGGDVLEEDRTTGKRVFRFLKGPLFANLILADEINRTPPKTQSALLEAMEERQLSVGGTTYPLPEPFFVLATQNPIEVEGTYPLPEAQLDRFLMKIKVHYPNRDDEREICRRQTTDYSHDIEHVVDVQTLLQMQSIVPKVIVADHVYEAAIDLARMTSAGRRQASARTARQDSVWRRPPGQHRLAHGRQGAGAAAQALPCDDGRYLRGCAARVAAPHHSDVQRRSGGARHRPDRQNARRSASGDPSCLNNGSSNTFTGRN